MPTLSARYVKKSKHIQYCDWCEYPITAEHMYLFGMAHDTEKPYGMRLHIKCSPWDKKTKAELQRVGLVGKDE